LTREDFNELIIGDCVYCGRSPSSWFGIDRIIPELGYVIDNVVPCCFDCNVDKHVNSAEETTERNKKIVERLESGCFDLEKLTEKVPKTILHKGSSPSSKKVCAYGKVYKNRSDASKALGKAYTSYVSICVREGRQPDDIFNISNEFYDEYIDSDIYITKQMCIGFEHFYINDA
jgi:hypothetical protein